jgi:hypothetical protein
MEPFGDERGDFQAGVVASTLAQINTRRGGKHWTPEDFMYFRKAQLRGQDALLSERIKEAFSRLPRA